MRQKGLMCLTQKRTDAHPISFNPHTSPKVMVYKQTKAKHTKTGSRRKQASHHWEALGSRLEGLVQSNARVPSLSIVLFLGDAKAICSGSRCLPYPQEYRIFFDSSSILSLMCLNSKARPLVESHNFLSYTGFKQLSKSNSGLLYQSLLIC